jgi:hypothetical protein
MMTNTALIHDLARQRFGFADHSLCSLSRAPVRRDAAVDMALICIGLMTLLAIGVVVVLWLVRWRRIDRPRYQALVNDLVE